MSDLRLLIKFPTRNRPVKFLQVLYRYIEYATGENQIMVNIDEDDRASKQIIPEIPDSVTIHLAPNKSKVEAINVGMDEVEPWDIVLLASDDMIPRTIGYDKIIKMHMQAHFPDTDGVLWFNDGYTSNRLNTLAILGRKYYERFGYIYHPEYTSLWCDNEFMEVAGLLGKQRYFNNVIIKHEHPNNTKLYYEYDAQYRLTESFYKVDQQVYNKRRKNCFGLNEIINTHTNP